MGSTLMSKVYKALYTLEYRRQEGALSPRCIGHVQLMDIWMKKAGYQPEVQSTSNYRHLRYFLAKWTCYSLGHI